MAGADTGLAAARPARHAGTARSGTPGNCPASSAASIPKTGEIKEYPLKTPQTGPHGLVEDKDGNIWFTGNHMSLIGKLDPKTGNVTEYKMPDPKAKDPHTIAIDQSGIVWFTVQNANMLGRIDPKSGEIKLVHLAHAEFAALRPGDQLQGHSGLRRVRHQQDRDHRSRKTMAIKEYALPNAASRPRRLALTPDDVVWYADFSRGYLGRLDLATGEHKEWPSPSGPQVAALRHRLHQGRDLVQRIRRQAEHHRALRSEDGEVPELGDPRRRRHRAQHGRHPDGNPVTANSLVNQVGMVEVE